MMEKKYFLFWMIAIIAGVTMILSETVFGAVSLVGPANYTWSGNPSASQKFTFSIDNATGIDANCTLNMDQTGGLVNQYGVVNQTTNDPTSEKFAFSNMTAINLTVNNANSSGYVSGRYYWNVSCINNSGTIGGVVTTSSLTRWFLYDGIAPTGNISTPSNKSFINTALISINGTINDSYSGPNFETIKLQFSNSSGACWQWSNRTWGSCNADPNAPGSLPGDLTLISDKTLRVNSSNFNVSYSFGRNITNITLSDDEYNFVIHGGDTIAQGLGNPNYGVINISFVYDTTPPAAAIHTVNLLSNNSWINNRVIRINLTVIDRATDHFNISLFNSASAIDNSTNITTGNATASLFNVTITADGTYTVNLTAVDNATNKNSTVLLFYIRADATVPNSTIFSVNGFVNKSWVNTRVWMINVTAADVNINHFNVTINATNSTNISTGGVYNTVYNLSVSGSEGVYRINLATVDNASNINSSPALYVGLDLTTPNSSINNISSKVNNSWVNNRMLNINFTASDTNIKNWSISVYNTTDVFNSSPSGWNYTYFESNTSAEVNFSAPLDGTYTFNLTTIDNASNVNTTALFYIRVDATNPSIGTPSFSGISSSGASISVEIGESNLNSCTYSGGSSGTLSCSGGTCTASISGLSASTIYSYSVACTDLAGNSATGASNSFTSSSASSGSGSGGSGGGSGSSVAGQFSKKVWSSLYAGETAAVKVAEGDGIGATEVSFKVDKIAYGVIADVKKVDKTEVPAEIGGKKVHNYLKIAVTGAIKEENTLERKVLFKVAKKWLADNSVSKDKLALYRYADSKWNALPTKFTQEDDTTVYYSAETPGFSYFAIAESDVAVESLTPAKEELSIEEAPVAEEPETPVEEAPATEAEVPAPEGKSNAWLLVVLAVVVIAAIIAAVYFWPKKKGKGF